MPIEYFAEYDLSDAKTFGESFANDEGKLFSAAEIHFKTPTKRVIPNGWHIPSAAEWAGIIPVGGITMEKYGNRGVQKPVQFQKFSDDDKWGTGNTVLTDVPETMQIGAENAPKTYLSDYYRPFKVDFIVYALRFRKDSKITFDNSQLAAFRYQLRGLKIKPESAADNTKNYRTGGAFHLKVTVRYLGNDFTGTVENIATEDFWNSNNNDDVTRYFSAGGLSSENWKDYEKYTVGYYWSSDNNIVFSFGLYGAGMVTKNNLYDWSKLVRCVADK
jgi:hypothetical protein